jgi:hypothetical protein
LTIDDLSDVYVKPKRLENKKIAPFFDWGFSLDNDGSLYRFFLDSVVKRNPEMKVTFFLPLGIHGCPNPNSSYEVENHGLQRKDFLKFIKNVQNQYDFEIAAHGINHNKYTDVNDPEIRNNVMLELSYIDPNEFKKRMKEIIDTLHQCYGIKVVGGRSPGYENKISKPKDFSEMGLLYWNFDFSNLKSISPKIIDDLVIMPSNVPGDLLNNSPTSLTLKNILKEIKKMYKLSKLIKIYESGNPIIVAEHSMFLRTDGRFQSPSIYADVDSINAIYALFKRADVWHATCAKIAKYFESYSHSSTRQLNDKRHELIYNGKYRKPFITVVSNSRELKYVETGEIIKGYYKQGYWIYNTINSGIYEEIG